MCIRDREETEVIQEFDCQMQTVRASAGAHLIKMHLQANANATMARALGHWTLVCVHAHVARLRMALEEAEQAAGSFEEMLREMQQLVSQAEVDAESALSREDHALTYGKRLAQEVLDRQAERLQLSELVVTRKVECSRLRGLVWGWCSWAYSRLADAYTARDKCRVASVSSIQNFVSQRRQWAKEFAFQNWKLYTLVGGTDGWGLDKVQTYAAVWVAGTARRHMALVLSRYFARWICVVDRLVQSQPHGWCRSGAVFASSPRKHKYGPPRAQLNGCDWLCIRSCWPGVAVRRCLHLNVGSRAVKSAQSWRWCRKHSICAKPIGSLFSNLSS
eukprot:TRINITY_DN20241_c0_g1_i2.p1 TRINITY_DN20241_c0_g1~~TRINITY_DN20241_c0_g1_i2.p1  ORF type:complete len:332 (-),score=37.27 TRINITY_DN20241_c0_g1_i2:277-1272(-)